MFVRSLLSSKPINKNNKLFGQNSEPENRLVTCMMSYVRFSVSVCVQRFKTRLQDGTYAYALSKNTGFSWSANTNSNQFYSSRIKSLFCVPKNRGELPATRGHDQS